MATKTTDVNFTAVCDQALQSFSDTFKATVKMQEDAAKWWSDVVEQAGPAQDWQRRARSIFTDTIPAVQKNAEEWLKVFETNSNRSMDLLRKAFDSNGAVNPTEIQGRVQELWEESLGVLRENAQSMAQVNVKMMELWAELVRKNVSAAAKTAATVGAKA